MQCYEQNQLSMVAGPASGAHYWPIYHGQFFSGIVDLKYIEIIEAKET